MSVAEHAIALEISELVDLEKEPGCEHSQHQTSRNHTGPAAYVLRLLGECGECGYRASATILICEPGYSKPRFIRCPGCSSRHPKGEWWTVVSEL